MITLHSSITALAKSSELQGEGQQTLILEAMPNERFNQDLYVSLVLKPITTLLIIKADAAE